MKAMSVAVGLLVLGMFIPACGGMEADATSIADPALGLDEDAACLDPNWYCASIGGTNNCAIGSCGTIGCTLQWDGSYQTYTCENGGTSWLVSNPDGLYPAGDYPCTVTDVGYSKRATPVIFICRADFVNHFVLELDECAELGVWSQVYYHQNYQDHFVNNPGTCIGFVQCRFPRVYERKVVKSC